MVCSLPVFRLCYAVTFVALLAERVPGEPSVNVEYDCTNELS